MRILLRLAAFARKYWVWLSLSFFFLLASTVFSLVVPQILGDAINTMVSRGQASFLMTAALLVLGASVLRGLTGYANGYLSEAASQQIAYDIRNTLYDKIQSLSFSYHDKTQTGQLMSRATADVEATRLFFSRGLLGLLQIILLFVGIVYLLVITDWRLAVLSLIFIPPIGLRAIITSRRLRFIWMKIQQQLGVIGTILEENLTGVRIVKAFSRQKEESQKFIKEAKTLYDNEIAVDRQLAFNMPLMVFLVSLPTAVILWYGGQQVIAGTLTIGGLTQFMLYLGMLAMPIRRLGFVTNLVSRSVSAGERVIEVLDARSGIQEKPGALDLKDLNGEVCFENVTFSYDSTAPVLRNVSFCVPPGKLVALVGGSGSGKSTIAQLIPRFYDVTGGRITIDGLDIRDVNLASLRRNIGIVQQDIFLFSATIKENIAYGAADASMEQVKSVARAVQLHSFIESLPDGYDTVIGERGITLSGGERQRLAIARTLLTNPRILIMDDSTSNVDAETEKLIRRDLTKLIRGRTTFIITHRLPIIRNADLILVLQDGQIVESGTHNGLMAKSTLYRQIYESQLAAARVEDTLSALSGKSVKEGNAGSS